MKRGEKNRGEKLFEKLMYSDKFQEGISFIRKKLSIPIKGGRKDVFDWYSKSYKPNELIILIENFLQKQKLPNNDWWKQKIIEYLFFNGKYSFLPRTYPTTPFIEIVSRNKNYVDLRIYDGAAVSDVKNFIEKNWDITKPPHDINTSKSIQPQRNHKIDKELIKLWNTPKENLGTDTKSKEILVGRSLKGKFKKGGKFDFEAVKMRAYRKKHAKR